MRLWRLIAIGLAALAAAVSLSACSPVATSPEPTPSEAGIPQATTAIPAVDNDSVQAIRTCNRPAGSGVLLTFDDFGTPQQVRAILTELRYYNMRAAFFPTGEWAEKNMDLIADIRREGHIVGNHTYTHAPLGKLINSGKKADEAKFYGEIYPTRDVANTSPMLLRPPYEDGAFDPKVIAVMNQKGYQLCTWTADTYDWHGDTVAQMTKRLEKGDKYSPKPLGKDGVVLMHMHSAHAAEMVGEIYSIILGQGLFPEHLK